MAVPEVKYHVIFSDKLNEKIVYVEDSNFKRGVSKDGEMAMYTPDEFELIKGLSVEHLQAINLVKKTFDGKIEYNTMSKIINK